MGCSTFSKESSTNVDVKLFLLMMTLARPLLVGGEGGRMRKRERERNHFLE